jgi:nucleotide-binding universal stress UspA family protein
MPETILVATDGSTHAEKAVMLAAELAQSRGARLHLFHVLLRDKEPADLRKLAEHDGLDRELQDRLARLEAVPTDSSVPEWAYAMDPASVPSPVPDELLRELGDQVLDAAERDAKSKGLDQITRGLEGGPAAERIVAAAREERAETIVMGHRGLRDIDAITFGSVSNEVSRLAECSVVMIK